MPTMCGDGGGFGTGRRGELRRQHGTLWRVRLLLHGRLRPQILLRAAWQERLSPTTAVPAALAGCTGPAGDTERSAGDTE